MRVPDVTINDRVSIGFHGDPTLIEDLIDAIKTAVYRSNNLYLNGESSRIYSTRKGETGLNRTIEIRVCAKMLPEPNHLYYLTN